MSTQSAGKLSSAELSPAKQAVPSPRLTTSAWPMADPSLAQELLDLVQQASHHRQLRKGANEGDLPYSPYKAMHYLAR